MKNYCLRIGDAIDILYLQSNPWSGVFDLANQKIIFSNADANLIVHYQCK